MHRKKNSILVYRGHYSAQHPLGVLESMPMDMEINALALIPCCLHDNISLAILFPTSSFSLFLKSFALDYKHAAIPQISQKYLLKIIFPSSPSSISLLPFYREIAQEEWCLLIFQFLLYQ